MKLIDLGEGIQAWDVYRNYFQEKDAAGVCDFPAGNWALDTIVRPPEVQVEIQDGPFAEEPDPWLFRAMAVIFPLPERKDHCLLEMISLGYIGYDGVKSRSLNCKKCDRGIKFKGVWWNF